jgi:hypothetical protein
MHLNAFIWCLRQVDNDMRLLCEHLVDKQCLILKGPQACTDELMADLLAAQTGGSTSTSRPAPVAIALPVVSAGMQTWLQLPRSHLVPMFSHPLALAYTIGRSCWLMMHAAAAVIAMAHSPIALGGMHTLLNTSVCCNATSAVLLIAAVAGFLLWRRHKGKQQAAAVDAAAAPSQLSSKQPSSVTSSLLTVATYSSAGNQGSDVERGLQRMQLSMPCSSMQEGWVVTNSITSPAVGAVEDDSIEFGECSQRRQRTW